jgi:transketolase C-terminal domain/subunit
MFAIDRDSPYQGPRPTPLVPLVLELVKQHLNPGGVITQWVPLYESDPATVKSEIATFLAVFPEGTVWSNDQEGEGYDLVLLGQVEPMKIDADALDQRLQREGAVAKSLQEVGFRSGVALLGTYAGQGRDLIPWLTHAEINQDRSLRLQYLAGLGLNLNQGAKIYDDMLRYRKFPEKLFVASDLKDKMLKLRITPPKPEQIEPARAQTTQLRLPAYTEPIATRKAFGEALAALASDPQVVVLDGEVGNSTHTEDFQKVAPDRFLELYIAEQCMVGAAVGLQALGKTAFAATFGAFLTRAADQIRMGAISRADLRISGSHAGISIGEDGPSQMAVEDLSQFRTLNGSTVLYPADGNSAVQLVTTMLDLEGISYLRSTREATPALYPADETFPIGGSKTLASSGDDRVTLVAAGITLHESLAARDLLDTDGIAARVLDCYSVKPIDATTLRRALDETDLLVVIEDHRVEGGLGDAVLDALAATGPLHGRVVKIGVDRMPGSATAEQLRSWAGIDAAGIAARVRDLLR